MPVLLKRFKNLLIPSLHLGITYQGWKIISMKLGLADKYLNFFPCSHWLLSRAVWSVEEDAAILPVIWYLQARNLGLWWFVLVFFLWSFAGFVHSGIWLGKEKEKILLGLEEGQLNGVHLRAAEKKGSRDPEVQHQGSGCLPGERNSQPGWSEETEQN